MANFRMPAEWEPHAATWIAWPHNIQDWPGKFAPIGWVYADIVRHLHLNERVYIIVQDAGHQERATRTLRRAGVDLSSVRFVVLPTDRVWVRDSGPVFVADRATGKLAIADWKFNAWAKYSNWTRDDALPSAIAKLLKIKSLEPQLNGRRIVLEGGSIDVNGAGLLLTTEECLLSPVQARNPGLDRNDIEMVMRQYLGVQKVIWLRNGIVGDDTHGHVDDLARFVARDTVVIVSEKDRTDANYELLRENVALLKDARNLRGRPLRVVTLPMPAPVVLDGQRLPASYANFYVANGVVLVPTFNDPQDRIALNTLQDLFPTRTVCGIHCLDLIWGLGALHCMTQQQPKAQ